MAEHWIYLIPIAVLGYILWSRRSASTSDVKAMLGRGAQVVDVRTKSEFRSASHPKSINMPLDELERRAKELDPSKPVLVCCASGMRSGVGVSLLKKQGFKEVHNLGSWSRIKALLA